MTIKILLVDDQDLIRRGLRALLKTDRDLVVVGEASNGREAIDLVGSLQPDVVLMDVRMPEMDGVAATGEIVRRFPRTKVLILTTFDDREYVSQAIQFGAAGYLLKDTPFDELTQAIGLVYKGYTQLGPGLVERAIQPTPPADAIEPESIPIAWADLTAREREIVDAIAQGYSNREIAETLFIAEKTVKNNLTQILNKLDLRDRTQLAILAVKIASSR
jgi:DNA-binding NarL/FixJ family response regulator